MKLKMKLICYLIKRIENKFISIDSWRSESMNSIHTNNDWSKASGNNIILNKEIMNAKIPLPPPPLNIK